MSPQSKGSRGPGLAAILRRALGRLPATGETLELPLDLAVLGGSAGPETARLVNDGGGPVWDSARVALTIDFPAPNVELRVPRSRTVCRDFAARQKLRHVFDLNLGIGAQVLMEMGVVAPGMVVAGCGRCLHQVGAAGVLAVGAEPGVLARTLANGRLPFRMPGLVRLVFEGQPRSPLSAFDLGLLAARALEEFSADTLVEFGGRAVEQLSMDGRITLVDIGAEAMRGGLVPADGVTRTFFAERRAGGAPLPAPGKDEDDLPTRILSLDGAVPMIQGPGPGGPLRPVADLTGKKIHSAFIGSCAAGRHPDLMEAAGVVKRAKRIHPDVRLTLAPATLEVARSALTAGFYEIFINAGAMLSVPGSSPGMASGGAAFGEGEIILSTVPYNSAQTDAGRGPEVYRASPVNVAAAAVAGEIKDPAGH